MADRVHNPFQTVEIRVPDRFHPELRRYCQGSIAGASIDMSPFPRMIDFWFLSICVAVRLELEPANIGKEKDTTKITDGTIFMSDPWRIHTLMLIAVGKTNDEQIVSDPWKMIALANGLAAAGLPMVIEMLEGKSDTIWNLSDAVSTLLRKGEAA